MQFIKFVGTSEIIVIALFALLSPEPRIEDILSAYQEQVQYNGLTISYPLDDTVFPPEIVSPTFHWKDSNSKSDTWLITVKFQDDKGRMNFLTHSQQWKPEPRYWEMIKKRSLEKKAEVTILGVNRAAPAKILSGSRILIKTSKDEVGAPLFYREVNLPFVDAVKDPSHIRWRFGPISSEQQPPVILENLPVCGNCHSFCNSARTMAMDVDYANSKGSYVITRVAEQMVLATSDIITWNDYRKEDDEQTFGLLSQISPDGRYVVSTVKDKSVFVPMPPLAFSQLFFPVKGILCVYDTQTRTFRSLPGADDPQYVQSNPTWSPDGKYIVFARADAYDLRDTEGKGKVLLTREECKEFTEDGKPFLFDLCRIPFNNGRGGEPEPLKGASNNGVSNFFAKYSLDGKWIVFCKARSYMLLQPDSELYIIPAEGGEARRLQCNTTRMNSWHSWSPNSKWLVFSSKASSAYTQLYLTHIDEQGNSTPAILLDRLTAPDRAANIPEFVNAAPSAIKKIREGFLNDYSFVRAGNEFYRYGESDNAIEEYRNALELNPNNAEAHQKLGFLLYHAKSLYKEGLAHSYKAIQLDPRNARAHNDVGMALLHQRKYDEAIKHLSTTLQLMPKGLDTQYNLVDMRYNLGNAFLLKGDSREAAVSLSEAVRLDPNHAQARYRLALALADQGEFEEALRHYSKAVKLKPDVDTSAALHYLLAIHHAQARRFREAISSAERALELARAAGEIQFAERIMEQLEIFKQVNNSLKESDFR
ncbi:MAG: tetratricopeptide repeat protein [Phycisphaerales bacterium]|nr:MAG: tetratricopeptide repeat protein [Phycisphaerales bacterium]